MTLLRNMATFVTQAKASDLPSLDREILHRHVADVVVARIAGGHSHEGVALAKLFGTGDSPEAIACQAGLVRLTEMDDIHLASTTTPSSVAVPVALGLAAQTDCEPQDIESAILVGTELLVRFGKAMNGASVISKGFWPTRSAATLAACATSARLLRLGLAETHEALSLAATMTNGPTGRFSREPSGRWIVFIAAVSAGIRCALAARSGFNGSTTAPDANWIGRSLGIEFDENEIINSLGYGSIYPELSLKPFGTARQCLGAAEAMAHLIANGLTPASISQITIRVPNEHVAMISQRLDARIRSTSFVSVAGQVATAAISPLELYDVERTHVLNNEAIFRLANLCHIVGDPALDALMPNVWAAGLDILTNGAAISHTIHSPLGSPENRMTDAQLIEKAHGALDRLGEGHRVEEVVDLSRTFFTTKVPSRTLPRYFAHG